MSDQTLNHLQLRRRWVLKYMHVFECMVPVVCGLLSLVEFFFVDPPQHDGLFKKKFL